MNRCLGKRSLHPKPPHLFPLALGVSTSLDCGFSPASYNNQPQARLSNIRRNPPADINQLRVHKSYIQPHPALTWCLPFLSQHPWMAQIGQQTPCPFEIDRYPTQHQKSSPASARQQFQAPPISTMQVVSTPASSRPTLYERRE